MTTAGILRVGAAVGMLVLAHLQGSKLAATEENMPGKCDEWSDPNPGGGWTHGHEFGTTGARYECGAYGCHTGVAAALCHQEPHSHATVGE